MKKYSKQEFETFLDELVDFNKRTDDFQESQIEFHLLEKDPEVLIYEYNYSEAYRPTEVNKKYSKRANKMKPDKIVFEGLSIVFDKEIKDKDIIFEIYNNYNKYTYRYQVFEKIQEQIKGLEEEEVEVINKIEKQRNLSVSKTTLKQYVSSLSDADKKTLKKLLI